MSSFMSGVSRFLHRHGIHTNKDSRRNSPRDLSEDMHRQENDRGWDAEENEETRPIDVIPNPSGTYYAEGSGSMPFDDSTSPFYTLNVDTANYGQYSWTDTMTLQVNDPAWYTFALANGQEIRIRLIENNNAMEIEYDGDALNFVTDINKITLKRNEDWDEERNASQDIRTHEESAENNTHSMPYVLQPGQTIYYTQQ